MKLIATKTAKEYASLMTKLEKEGYMWIGGDKPTDLNYWWIHKEKTRVEVDGKLILSIHGK